ncbi:hypothetical protein ZEAMMB73_Zm00001d022074 [Zea mays]|jgi:hypothetical protein|uniref:Uncharacterized protein n=1 Tax=Zea mays TaxID=4577 RepID=A0A1D6IJ13_MAIZE|nr:hypothetical protein ZEAMMB73_Zm00001d022074 [Zea mays]
MAPSPALTCTPPSRLRHRRLGLRPRPSSIRCRYPHSHTSLRPWDAAVAYFSVIFVIAVRPWGSNTSSSSIQEHTNMKMDDDGDDYTFGAAQPLHHLRFVGDAGIMGPPLLYQSSNGRNPFHGLLRRSRRRPSCHWDGSY